MNVLVEMEIPKGCEECPFAYETEGVSHDFCQYVGYESDDGSYTYYEIWNTTSERTSECTERCVDIETAKAHLANAHCDWYRPAGTGRIYGVTLVPTEDGSITRVGTMVYENK